MAAAAEPVPTSTRSPGPRRSARCRSRGARWRSSAPAPPTRRVAAEAALTARVHGAGVDEIRDVGVAGLHRLLGVRDRLEQADCLVVVAGMEGALPSVVGGLTGVPLVAVPTSVGYGASFGGLAALLAMLNSCAPGVTVVNIDNGYGAGRLRRPGRPPGQRDDRHHRLGRRLVRCQRRHAARALCSAPAYRVDVLQAAVDAIAPEPVALRVEEVSRNGFAATRCHVEVADSVHHRTWRDIRRSCWTQPTSTSRSRDLAAQHLRAAGRRRGHRPRQRRRSTSHFHEVGALDAIADVVGVCAGFVHLGDRPQVVVSPVAVGSGLGRRRPRHAPGPAAGRRRAAPRGPVVRRPGRARPRWSCARPPAPRC